MANDRIPLETLRRSLGRVARDVERGGFVVVERRGEEAFALVPMRLYRLLEEERRALVESTGRAREAFSDLSEDEVESLVAEEIEAVRDRSSAPGEALLDVIGSGGLPEEEARELATRLVRRARKEGGIREPEAPAPSPEEVRARREARRRREAS